MNIWFNDSITGANIKGLFPYVHEALRFSLWMSPPTLYSFWEVEVKIQKDLHVGRIKAAHLMPWDRM